MNYIKITPMDIANGPGIHTTLWVAGCGHHCLGCQNPDTWDSRAGQLFDDAAKQELFAALAKPYVQGLTLSGGDPMFKANLSEINNLVKEVKQKFPDKDIWLWTGYTWEEMRPFTWFNRILVNIDVLVDGPFIQSQRDITLEWRGSKNQRIIDVQKSLENHSLILWKDGNYK